MLTFTPCPSPPAAVTLQQRELDTLGAQTQRDGPAMAQKEDAVARLQTSIRHSTRDIEAKRAEMGTPLQVRWPGAAESSLTD